MFGINYVHIDVIFAFYGYVVVLFLFLLTHLYCSVGCLRMIGHILFWVSYIHVFCICTCSAQLSMFFMERRSRNTVFMIIIYSLSIP